MELKINLLGSAEVLATLSIRHGYVLGLSWMSRYLPKRRQVIFVLPNKIIMVSIIAQPRKSLSSNISYKMVIIVVPRAAFLLLGSQRLMRLKKR